MDRKSHLCELILVGINTVVKCVQDYTLEEDDEPISDEELDGEMSMEIASKQYQMNAGGVLYSEENYNHEQRRDISQETSSV